MTPVRLAPSMSLLVLLACYDRVCAHRILEDVPVMQGGLRAVVLQTNCGAASSLRFHVALLQEGEKERTLLTGVRAVFTLRDARRPPDAPPERLRVRWLSRDSISIMYDHRLAPAKQDREERGVHIVYGTW